MFNHSSKLFTTVFVIAATAFGISRVASADAQIAYKNSNDIQTALIKKGKVLIQNASDKNTEMLYNSANQTMTVIDHAEKSYMLLDAQTIEQLTSQLSGIKSAMKQQLDNLSPEQREQLSAFLGGISTETETPTKTVISVKSKGKSSSNGYACDDNSLLEDGAVVGSFCLANAVTLKINNADYQTMVSMQNFMFDMAQKAKSSLGDLGNQIPNLGGLKVNRVVISGNMNNEPENSFSLQSSSAKPVTATMSVPAGYRQQDTSSLGSLIN
ncbi:MAG: hypothetical protein ACRBHB_19930 [Arenicella sp.]